MISTDHFIRIAKEHIREQSNEKSVLRSMHINVIWYSHTNQNHKGIFIRSGVPGVMYEVTYNGDKDEMYLDIYQRLSIVNKIPANPIYGNTDFAYAAAELVGKYIRKNAKKEELEKPIEIYSVWIVKTLQNHSAMLSSTINDGLYYSVEYNGDNNLLTMYAYKHEENIEYDNASKFNNDRFGFDNAIRLLKLGFALSREGWNGKEQYIEICGAFSYENANGEIVNAKHDDISNQAIVFHGTRGDQVGWLASQADMLADDWMIYPLKE